MDRALLVGFLLCFVCALVLSVVLFFKDVSWLRKNKHTRFWERTVDLLFSICQAGLSIAGIVAITIAFTTHTEPDWLFPVILGALQLMAGANVSVFSIEDWSMNSLGVAYLDDSWHQSFAPIYMAGLW
jgi:uncharacterized membrane protein HdeD (DUF308 family)